MFDLKLVHGKLPYALSICVAAAMLAGCGGSQPPIGASQSTGISGSLLLNRQGDEPRHLEPLTTARLASSTSDGTYKVSAGLLYVAMYGAEAPYDQVNIYDTKAKDPSPLAVITDGVSEPQADCIDSDGTLYITSQGTDDWVTEYKLGKTEPSTTITDGIDGPGFCAIDGHGDLWVSNNGGAASVTEYLKGTTHPHTTITSGLTFPIGIAIDRRGNLYVANHVLYGATNVQVYAPGDKSPSRTITDGVNWPVGIAVDSHATLYVTNDVSGINNIEEYRDRESHPYREITKEMNGPAAITFAYSGWMYVTNTGSGGTQFGPPHVILEFPPGSITPSKKMISKGLYAVLGTAYYPPLLP